MYVHIGVRLLRHSKTQTEVTKMLSCAQLQALEMSVTIVIAGFMLLAFTLAFLMMSQSSLFVLSGAQNHPLLIYFSAP